MFQLEEVIKAEVRRGGLQVTPFTMTKVIQLYETKNSRHSSMLVGKTGCGKSVTWKILQVALTAMHRKAQPGFQTVQVGGGLTQQQLLLSLFCFVLLVVEQEMDKGETRAESGSPNEAASQR